MNKREIKSSARQLIKSAQLESWYPYESMDNDPDSSPLESIFLGTIFSIMPSGKYYMPFACSNVDSCPRCKGSGLSKKTHTCVYCNGMTYRTISQMAAIRKSSYKETFESLHKDNLTWITTGCFTCNVCNGTGINHPTCNYCNGLGSREAYEDSLMSDYLDKFASELGQSVESGEGDSCDLFLIRESQIDTESN